MMCPAIFAVSASGNLIIYFCVSSAPGGIGGSVGMGGTGASFFMRLGRRNVAGETLFEAEMPPQPALNARTAINIAP